MLKTIYFAIITLSILTLMPSVHVYAASGVGRVVHTYGPAWVERGNTREKVRKGRVVLRNDSIITGSRGRVKLIMGDGSKVYIGAKSRISLRKYSLRGKRLLNASIDMLWGKARFFVNKLASRGASFRVRTSTAVLGVRGTEFSVWVPPTDALLSHAFDQITLKDIPALPTRMVLIEGAVDVDNGSGIQYRLTPGNTADVDSERRIQVRKTNHEDLEDHAKPLVMIEDDADTDLASRHEQPEHDGQPEKVDDMEKNQDSARDTDTDTHAEENGRAQRMDGDKSGGQHQGGGAVSSLPDNPRPADAAAIMLGGNAGGIGDQPQMPKPPAVVIAGQPASANLPDQVNGNTQPTAGVNNNGLNNTAAPNQNLQAPVAPLGAAVNTQATTNAIQNLGRGTAIEMKPNFVQP